jgi:hypothetical protein
MLIFTFASLHFMYKLYIFLFQVAKKAVERWAVNLMCVQSFCQKKFGLDLQTLDKHFGISEHLDF